MSKLHDPFGPTRTNLAPLYQSGNRPDNSEELGKLPVEPTTGHPLAPREQPGYYPGFNTLAQQAYWDEATRTPVLDRVNNVPPLRFFAPEEAPLMQAVVARILPQDDRVANRRIPVLNRIDQRLFDDVQDGYRFEGMPLDREAFHLGIKGIQAIAQHEFQQPFETLTAAQQDQVLLSLHDANPPAGEEIWQRLPVTHFWQLLVQDCIEGYYSHPYAWDEVGFGGPAYPRGYMRLENGEPEPWEVREQRYAWSPPPAALSGRFSPLNKAAGGKTPTPGQEGTHCPPLPGPFGLAHTDHHSLGPIQQVDLGAMRHHGKDDEVDFAIVGVGAAGGVLVQRLARAGFRVVAFDAGPFWDVERDWVSDEAGSHKLYWNEPRITGGTDPVALGSNNSGHAVGGGTVHWAGFVPRFHPSDFRTYSEDGIGVDWPIPYDELKPYYAMLEKEIPVAGPPNYPWGDPHGYTYGPHPSGGVTNALVRGCTNLGIRVVAGGPVAINSGSHADRPHCIYRGFCIQGCKVGAKQSTLYSHVPDAIRHGAEIRPDCMVVRVNVGKGPGSGDPLVTGVTYFDATGQEQQQRAKVVIIAGYAIETPRLLLNSACAGFENGLANSSETVGRYLMVQAGNVVLGRFSDPIRMYKVPPANGLTEEFYETDPKRDFARGFAIQTVGPLPIGFAKQMTVAKGAWGWGLRQVMMDYNHWAAFGLLGELLPWADNRVTLADERDRHGLRIAKVTYSLKDNDKKLIDFGARKTTEVMWAAGAEEVVQEPRYAHLIGGARMGNDPRTSVVDSFGRSHDIPNLFCCDGSILPIQGSANPGLTIQAIAARTADYLIAEREGVLRRLPRPGIVGSVPIRHDLAPAGTSGRGVPRLNG